MIFTIIGIVIRCVAAWIEAAASDSSMATFSIVCNVIYIIFCIIGLIATLLGSGERSVGGTGALIIFQIVISLYFEFQPHSIVSRIVAIIVGFIAGGLILDKFGSSETSSSGEASSSWDNVCNMLDNMAEENLRIVQEEEEAERRRNAAEREARERYVRDNWNSDRGRLNSDGTAYEDEYGNWNKISRDGQRYEDNDGYWHNF